jgi:multidrug resistance efflux pump
MGQSSQSKSRARRAAAAGEPEARPAANPAGGRPEPSAAPIADADRASGFAGLDVAGRLTLLREAFEQRSRPGIDREQEPRFARLARLARALAKEQRRLLKALLGLAVIAVVGYMPVRALLLTTSTEAVVNARLITLRAPIEGEVAVGGLAGLGVGTEIDSGAGLLRIVNKRAERGRLDDLRRLISRLEGERGALMARRDDLQVMHADLAAQTRAFTEGRLRQLEARIAELASEIAAAEANHEEAERALARAVPLAASKTMTSAAFEKARRDAAVAGATLAALRHRLTGVEVEVSALRQGVFIGDSYNDRPRSSQRADEVAQRVSEVVADIREREAHIASLSAEIAEETRRFEEIATAELVAPVRGSVWEVMTAPGESVVRGQDLVRVLDCSGAVVTATVDEAAYNRLRIGDPARFRFRSEHADFKGRIVGLTGVATAPANLAIQPSALAKGPYRVTVAVPDLAKAGRCDIGRTGRVTFDR